MLLMFELNVIIFEASHLELIADRHNGDLYVIFKNLSFWAPCQTEISNLKITGNSKCFFLAHDQHQHQNNYPRLNCENR